MKRYRIRFLLANALIVVSALALAVRLLAWLIPGSSSAEAWLLPALLLLVSLCALAFGIVEAVALYREWSAAREDGQPPPEA